MTEIDAKFRFHPVGQGLFYSGQVNDFDFVYDCGSDSGKQYTDSAIDKYAEANKSRFEKEKLDLLTISHLHGDHMNAVKILFSKTNGVNEVVLPYLFPEERLMVAAEYAIENELDNLDDDYISFLSNPINY